MERNDIVALRCKFLREICTLRKVKYDLPIVYIDETWINQNHSRSMIQQNECGTEGLKIFFLLKFDSITTNKLV